MLVVLVLFFGLDLSQADFADAPSSSSRLGSLSFIGIGMMAAVLPLMYVERGAQMTFVLQSAAAARERRVLQRRGPARVDADAVQLSPATYVLEGVRAGAHRRDAHHRPAGPASGRWSIMAVVFIPLGIWMFGRAERYAKRTGKLKRVG